MKESYKPMFEPFTFRSGVTVKNRIMMAPMTNYSSDENDMVSAEELAYYSERSGGPGAVITAVAYIEPGGKGFPGQFSAADDSYIPSLRKLAETIQSKGAKAILQIFHAGRNIGHDGSGGDRITANPIIGIHKTCIFCESDHRVL